VDARRVWCTSDGSLRLAALAILMLAAAAAVLGLAGLGWPGVAGAAVVITGSVAAMIRYGNG
jgi:hypothetical protein